MKIENKLEVTKCLTVLILITILFISPLTVPIVFADNNDDGDRSGKSDKHDDDDSKPTSTEPASITAYINGAVTDLGVQKYTIEGKGGFVDFIGESIMVDPKISLKLKATVINDVVTGSLKLDVTSKIDGENIQLTVNIPVVDGDPVAGCIDLEVEENYVSCPETWTDNIMPYLELENGDFIPMLFFGVGEAILKIDNVKKVSEVYVVIDTFAAQHPFIGGEYENTGQVSIYDMSGLFSLSVDVTKFDVIYTGVQMEGGVSGDLEGDMFQVANSNEDHVNNVQNDEGDIVFNVTYNEEIIRMTGSYKGYSVQSKDLGYLYISTGTFTTSDDLTIKGEYVTSWTLPLFFTSTFTGIIK